MGHQIFLLEIEKTISNSPSVHLEAHCSFEAFPIQVLFLSSNQNTLHFIVMARTRLATKKLQPAKKAWKSFSNTVQHKLHKLNITKSIKATLQCLLSAFRSLSHLIHSKLHHSSSLITKRPQYSTSYYHVVQHKHCAAIHIDDLFDKANSMSMHATNKRSAHAQGETSKGKEKVKEKEEHSIYKGSSNLVGECHNQNNSDDGVNESKDLNTIEDAWKIVVAKSPQLRVDQKAEEFISKFREDMRLQKERSMLEFQEMLARIASLGNNSDLLGHHQTNEPN
ncbi:hypothetical protein CR513_52214, partial [Mucuna pruriens]